MLSLLGDWRRTHYCGELNGKNTGEDICVMGWVHRRRDHGGVIFIDLRDKTGLLQLVLNPEISPEAHSIAEAVRSEYVVAVKGKVEKRPEGTINENLPTGEIEIIVKEIKILNNAKTPPFQIEENTNVGEDVRLKYRYLDLRRPNLQKNIILRHNLTRTMREYLYGKGFLDIETPFLTKSTPEGARDYLVPSRVNPGKFYALPQSPQMFKQLLMISGYDRYFQIVRCFRDEDLRADRQPEFTQLDMEMSFIDRQDLMDLIEGLFVEIFQKVAGITVQRPFPVMTYAEAMEKYSHDAPDTRFELFTKTINDLVKDCEFKVFTDAIKEGGIVKAINAKGAGKFSRKEIDEITDYAVSLGAKGLAYIKINEDGLQSPIIKFLGEQLTHRILDTMDAKVGDIVFFGAGEKSTVNLFMSKVRLELGRRLGLIDKNKYNFTWVIDFPLLEWDKEEKRYAAVHHPFTAPVDEDIPLFDTDPLKIRAKAYDLVLNGSEIGGGSIRIHRSDIQEKMFNILGLTKEECDLKFGFFIEALRYGTPPHGGIAFGVDRIASILAGADSIRDVIAFPKTQKATCLMSDAPNKVDAKQLKELSIKLDIIEEK
ncbi:aspartate--tRNA ligase [Calditerrivibrio nitroreducens]|uniref:Aspartate--tRNA(Asp/Asn) ligase n=1 Tax=Calditerrivibrio nitroreducens (strain DSM 19672 / NBRC 101217 / Yu37-1) TaxID=768670 RepID=E4TH88_CALNY|nr:aspartate--tRNA ligase [Calditerrivibrio nitroreducens]ADR18782.1 aspartyl-tRNA synthetase [Calditerrivibrio nitroreducens DSM 19672]